MSSLEVFIDFKSPGSYLALAPLLALLERRSIALQWHPLRTRQESISLMKAEETRGETHRRLRALSRRRIHQKYAAIQGLPMAFPGEPGDTDLALQALLRLEHPIPFISAAFHAYWVDGADLNEAAVVANLLSETGYSLAVDDISDPIAALAAVTSQAQERGIPDAPAFVLSDPQGVEQVFVGREHLELIEALLFDRSV